MKVIMLSWELAPFHTGGLGVASYNITKNLAKLGIEIFFVLPRKEEIKIPFMKVLFASSKKMNKDIYHGYITPSYFSKYYSEKKTHYSSSLFYEVEKYAIDVLKYKDLDFDVIHAHDWLTIKAGIRLKELTGKPLIFHIHATEFDRAGLNMGHPLVHAVEKEGIEKADAIITVSSYTKKLIIKKYNADPKKIFVVHNAVEKDKFREIDDKIKQHYKIVLFLGRLTLQKGPDYFLRAAQKVLQHRNKVLFIMAGKGDMQEQLIKMAINLGIQDKVVFTGFLSNEEVRRLYGIADVYVMPSISEPFGISALEALASSTPLIVSKQAGVSELINHCFKVDFWDVDEMANKIIAILDHDSLRKELKKNGKRELEKISWENSAKKIKRIYRRLI